MYAGAGARSVLGLLHRAEPERAVEREHADAGHVPGRRDVLHL